MLRRWSSRKRVRSVVLESLSVELYSKHIIVKLYKLLQRPMTFFVKQNFCIQSCDHTISISFCCQGIFDYCSFKMFERYVPIAIKYFGIQLLLSFPNQNGDGSSCEVIVEIFCQSMILCGDQRRNFYKLINAQFHKTVHT